MRGPGHPARAAPCRPPSATVGPPAPARAKRRANPGTTGCVGHPSPQPASPVPSFDLTHGTPPPRPSTRGSLSNHQFPTTVPPFADRRSPLWKIVETPVDNPEAGHRRRRTRSHSDSSSISSPPRLLHPDVRSLRQALRSERRAPPTGPPPRPVPGPDCALGMLGDAPPLRFGQSGHAHEGQPRHEPQREHHRCPPSAYPPKYTWLRTPSTKARTVPEGVQRTEESGLQLGPEDAAGAGEVEHHEQHHQTLVERRPPLQERVQSDPDQQDARRVEPSHRPDTAEPVIHQSNTGPANAIPTALTANDAPTASAALIRQPPPAPHPRHRSPRPTRTDPILTATRRKKIPCPVGSPSAGGAASVTLSGAPCAAATPVRPSPPRWRWCPRRSVATRSSGSSPAGRRRNSSASEVFTAAARSATVRTLSAPSPLSCRSARAPGRSARPHHVHPQLVRRRSAESPQVGEPHTHTHQQRRD